MRHFPNRDLFDWHILCKCAVKFGETTRDSHFFFGNKRRAHSHKMTIYSSWLRGYAN